MYKHGLLLLMLLCSIGCDKESHVFNAYIDTDLIYISSQFTGKLVELDVNKGQKIESGQNLFKLEQTKETYDVDMAQSNRNALLAQREKSVSQLHYAKLNYDRVLKMSKKKAASQNDLESAENDLNAAQAQLAEVDAELQSSRANIAENKWTVNQKTGLAPDSGIIYDTYFSEGELVPAVSPVLSLITKEKIKSVFFVPEPMLSHIHLNDPVSISMDGHQPAITGHIAYISKIAEYTPPIIYSREERQRLVFRVEAKIDSPNLEQLHLGQPVSVKLKS